MALDPIVKKNWIELQKRYDYPVNALGMRIDPKDDFTINVWKTEYDVVSISGAAREALVIADGPIRDRRHQARLEQCGIGAHGLDRVAAEGAQRERPRGDRHGGASERHVEHEVTAGRVPGRRNRLRSTDRSRRGPL